MKKRALFLLSVTIIIFSAVSLRLYDLSVNVRQAAVYSAAKTVDVAKLRGTIYDCRMRLLTNSEYEIYAAAKPSNEALAAIKGKVLPDVFESVMQRMAKGNPVAVKVDSPVNSTKNLITAKVPVRYPGAFTASHIIGYLDSNGNGVSGIEKAYDGILSKNNSTVGFRFSSDAVGRVMLGESIETVGNSIPINGVVLTLDREIQRITESVLDASDADCSAAVVIEVESGAIRACVSRPSFNPYSVYESLTDEKSPLINRAFLPFSVGSVFKPVVAAAALENGISEKFEYNCTGSVVCNGVTFHCHKKDGHGLVDMKSAVANSCNTYFIALALELNIKDVISVASDFGFGKKTVLADGMESSAGNLPSAEELDSQAAIANFSFGQGAILATPLQICSLMATISGNGIYIEPYLIEGECDENGKLIRIYRHGEKKQVISDSTAKKIKGFLESVVESGSGKRAGSELVGVAGKTATAQTGRAKDGEEIYNAWFAGYFPTENPKYAVAILKEDGGEGAISCAPVFRMIAEKITAYEKT